MRGFQRASQDFGSEGGSVSEKFLSLFGQRFFPEISFGEKKVTGLNVRMTEKAQALFIRNFQKTDHLFLREALGWSAGAERDES